MKEKETEALNCMQLALSVSAPKDDMKLFKNNLLGTQQPSGKYLGGWPCPHFAVSSTASTGIEGG